MTGLVRDTAMAGLSLLVSEGGSEFFERVVNCMTPLGVSVKRADRLPVALLAPGEKMVAMVSINALAQERGWYGLTDVPVIWVGDRRYDGMTPDPLGGYRLLSLDFTSDELRRMIRNIIPVSSDDQSPALPAAVAMQTSSELMTRLLEEVSVFGSSDQSVLIEGETGVGKELVAGLLHQAHPLYSKGPFVPVNCGAVPEGLFESLFFGHAKGAFTGALQPHKGYLQQAHGGTLFLDELGEMPLLQQVKLLRVLESGIITRVGSETPEQLDFRLVAATNRSLRELVQQNTFRADLYYRIAVIELKVPNLEQRGCDDKLMLFAAMLGRITDPSRNTSRTDIPDWLLAEVAAMRFPGNARQLRNLADRIGVILNQTGRWDRELVMRALGQVSCMAAAPVTSTTASSSCGTATAYGRRELREGERERIIGELEKSGWQRQKTADHLGMSRKSLWEKMRRYGIANDGHEGRDDH